MTQENSRWVSLSISSEATGRDEGAIDVVEGVGPNFTDIVDLVEVTDGGVTDGVDRCAERVGTATDTGAVVNDVATDGEVGDGGALLLSPDGESIRPTLTHTTGLGGLETTASSTTSHTIGDTVGELKTKEH